MGEPLFHINKDAPLPDEWLNFIWKKMEPPINELINKRVKIEVQEQLKQLQVVDDYMPVQWFCDRYEFSKQTFYIIIKYYKENKHGLVDSYRQVKKQVYNVIEFKKALKLYEPSKPIFSKSFVKIA